MTNLSLPFIPSFSSAVEDALVALSAQDDVQVRGAVHTRPEIVSGLLDLCGYTPEAELLSMRLLEPACGTGLFLLEALERLLASLRRRDVAPSARLVQLQDALCAVEIHRPTWERARVALVERLLRAGLTAQEAARLVKGWLRHGDFLLLDLPGRYDVIVGNPPYVRQERIPPALLAEYKRRYSTLYDRADLYVPFFDRCLDLLSPEGRLGFICSNRWIKNKYGGPLREKISSGYRLDVYMDVDGASAFESEVDAYPAVTVMRRGEDKGTKVVLGDMGGTWSERFAGLSAQNPAPFVRVLRGVARGRDPWLVDSPEVLGALRALEATCPTLEEADAKVGIGVATGCDRVYIGPWEALPVEEERKLPLVMSGDLRQDHIAWSGMGLVNPWSEREGLVSLSRWPRLGAYLRAHEATLRARHVARARPDAWFKTIDRVYPSLVSQPKLLIPDIKGDAVVAYDEGRFYPHHNLYVITSRRWDLRALQAILRSSVALAFVAAYSVRMAGGFLRFQAQYLRRVRVPEPASLSLEQVERLRSHALSSLEALDEVVFAAYGLSGADAEAIRRFAALARVSQEAR